MQITKQMLWENLCEYAQKNAPVRATHDKKGRPRPRAVGKKGTNMFSPYPGNLKNNGIYRTKDGVVFDYNKVGYIGYANLRKGYIEKTVKDFCDFCVSLGGRIIKR